MTTARSTANVPAAAVTSLVRELDTEWAPDPWCWRDLVAEAPSRADLGDVDVLGKLSVPFLGGRVRRVPTLGAAGRLIFQDVAGAAMRSIDGRLDPGVLAYRVGSDATVEHYRDALARRAELEERLAADHSFVLVADVARFFPSVSLESAARVLEGSEAWPGLHRLLDVFERDFGYVLPEGYAASRALGNAVLLPLDAVVSRPFTRWVDDYRIYCESEEQGLKELDQLRHCATSLGFELSGPKTRVLASRAASSAFDLSLGVHAGSEVLAEPDRLFEDERYLRFQLRVAAETWNCEVLKALHEHGADQLPASSMPRLARALVACGIDTFADLVHELFEIVDELTVWRRLRLAYALWYASSAVVRPLCRELVDLACDCPAAAPIVARVVGRHAPGALPSVPLIGNAWSAQRAHRLASAEAGLGRVPAMGSTEVGPPVMTFL